ncbi:hypothetical protein A6R68_20795 [Neotoma lepida]|uniref:Uncharacterized protein n=1 Tax=Neotoma lepida TaxID=56216 RepID=A0A1A6HRB2_NEOLE|nr:hypothetical protein A6R68_20795 [Neotoma lepida]
MQNRTTQGKKYFPSNKPSPFKETAFLHNAYAPFPREGPRSQSHKLSLRIFEKFIGSESPVPEQETLSFPDTMQNSEAQ